MLAFWQSIHAKVKASAAAGLLLTALATALDAGGYHPDPRLAAAATVAGSALAGWAKRGAPSLADYGLSVAHDGVVIASSRPVTVTNQAPATQTLTITVPPPAG